jgi:uncharacterized protein (DUF433 family)
MVYQDCITIDPRIRSGQPCIKGTRIAIVQFAGIARPAGLQAESLAPFQRQNRLPLAGDGHGG